MFGWLFKKDISEPVVSFVENYKKCNFKIVNTERGKCRIHDKINDLVYVIQFSTFNGLYYDIKDIFIVEDITAYWQTQEVYELKWLTPDEKELIFQTIIANHHESIGRLERIYSGIQKYSRDKFKQIYCK